MPIRRAFQPITEPQLPPIMTRDQEAEAIAAAAAATRTNLHAGELNPHDQYLLRSAKAADSELLDGINSSRVVFGDDWSKTIGAGFSTEAVFTTSGFLDSYSGGGSFPAGITHINGFQTRHRNANNLWGMQAGCQHNVSSEFYFRTVTGGVWQPWRRVWNDGNFAPASHAQTFTPAIRAIATSTGGIPTTDNTQANRCGLEIQATANSAAYISFHRPGIAGVHFGLDTNNQLSVGGWSLGNNSYKIFHEGNAPLLKAPMPSAASAANSLVWSWNVIQIGLGVAEACCFAGTGGGPAAFAFYRIEGNPDTPPSVSHQISNISKTGAYSQTSDARVKSDFKPSPGLEILMQLEPLKYKHWNCIGFDDAKKKPLLGEFFIEKLGFIAQEVRKKLPEAVAETQSLQELYALDYNCILTVAVQAIKQQQRQIEELQAQVKKLQSGN